MPGIGRTCSKKHADCPVRATGSKEFPARGFTSCDAAGGVQSSTPDARRISERSLGEPLPYDEGGEILAA